MAGKKVTGFDEVISVGFSIQDISDIVATQMKKAQLKANLKIGVDGSDMVSSFLKEMKKLQTMQDKVTLDDPFQWDQKKILDEMKKTAKELDSALDLKQTPETIKLVEDLQNRLATLNTRFEDLGGEIPKAAGKGANAIKLLKEQLESLEDVTGLKDSDLSILIDKSSIDALNKQRDLVKNMFKEMQELTGIDFGSYFDLDLTKHKAQLDETMKKNAQLSKQLDELKNKMNGLSDTVANEKMPDNWQSGLQGELGKLEKQLSAAEAELQAYQDYIGDLGEKGIDTEEYDKAIKKQEELQNKVNELTKSLAEQEVKIKTYSERAESLVPKSELEKKTEEVKKLTAELEALREKASVLDDIMFGRLGKASVNNVNPETLTRDINGLLDKYEQDHQDYHYDKAALLYGKSGSKERIMRDNKDITDDLIARYNHVLELQKKGQAMATELGKLNSEIYIKDKELKAQEKQLEILKEQERLHAEAEKAALQEAQASKEKATALEAENKQLKENIELQKKKNEEAASQVTTEEQKTHKISTVGRKLKINGKSATQTQPTPPPTQTPVPTQAPQPQAPSTAPTGTPSTTIGNIDAATKKEIGAMQNLKTAIELVEAEAELKNDLLGTKEPQLVQEAVTKEEGDFNRLVEAIKSVEKEAEKKNDLLGTTEPALVQTAVDKEIEDLARLKQAVSDIANIDEQIGNVQDTTSEKKIPLEVELKLTNPDEQIANVQKQLAGKSVDIDLKVRDGAIDDVSQTIDSQILQKFHEGLPSATKQIVEDQDKIQKENAEAKESFVQLKTAVTDYVTQLKNLKQVSNNGTIPNLNQRKITKSDAVSAAETYTNSGFVDNEAENILVRYISRLKDADSALKSLGITSDDVIGKVKSKLQSALDVQEQYSATSDEVAKSQMQLSNVLKGGYLSDVNKNDINTFLKTIESNTSIKGFAKKVKESFGVEIPTSIKQATQAVREFDNASDQVASDATDGKTPFVEVDVRPKVDPAAFVNDVNTQISSAITGNNINPVSVPISLEDKVTGSDTIKHIVDSEIELLRKLVDYIDKEVVKAIKRKTNEFKNEAEAVGKYVTKEKGDLNKLISALTAVEKAIKQISTLTSKIHINVDFESIRSLNEALDKLKNKTIPDFSNLNALNDAIKLTKGRSAKFDEYATDIANGLDKLIQAFSKGNYSQQIDGFLNQIQRLSDTSSQFRDMVSALSNLDKIGKATAGEAVKNFNTATADYLTAYSKNDGSADALNKLDIAAKNLDSTYKALNDTVNQGLLAGSDVRAMYNERAKLIADGTQRIDSERIAIENNSIAVNDYINATKALYDAKTKILNDPLDASIDIQKLQDDVDAAKTILEDLRKNKQLTDQAFDEAEKKASAYATNYDNKAASLTEKRIEKINSLLNSGSLNKTIDKLVAGFSVFGDIPDNVSDKINDLRSNIATMSDETIDDVERIKAHFSFKTISDELSALLRKVREENPFQELSPKNRKLDFKDYIDAFDALQNKAKELNEALSNKAPEATIKSLREEVAALKKNLDDLGSKDNTKDFLGAKSNLTNALKSFSDSGLNQVYTKFYDEAKKSQEELNKKVQEGSIKLKDYVDKANEMARNLQRVSQYMDGAIVGTNIQDADEALKKFRNSLSGVGEITKNITGDTIDNEKNVYKWSATYKEADGTLKQVTVTYDKLTQMMSSNTTVVGKELVGLASAIDLLKKKYKELMVYWTSNALTPTNLLRYVRQAVSIVQEYDDALTEMRKVSDDSIETLKDFQKASFDIANQVGTTGLQLQKSTADWLRLGESMEDAVKSAETTSVLFNVSEFDNINTATDAMVSMSQAYKDIEKIDLVNRLNVVGNNFAISTAGLAEALQDSASALAVAGNDIDKSIALLTSANRVVQSPAEVGKGLRTIALRLTGTKVAVQELQDLGESTEGVATSVSKLRDTIKSATAVASNGFKGFDILTETGNYKDTYEINKMSPYQVIGMRYAIA